MNPLNKAPKFVIINPDVNAPASRDKDNLAVTSIFHTIQGEGKFSGHSALFLRLAGCNYGSKRGHCEFCDTAFSLSEATIKPVGALVAEIVEKLVFDRCNLLVITGGEPFRQADALAEFLPKLHKAWLATKPASQLTVQFETNGTYPIPQVVNAIAAMVKDHFSYRANEGYHITDVTFAISPKPVRPPADTGKHRYAKSSPTLESIKAAQSAAFDKVMSHYDWRHGETQEVYTFASYLMANTVLKYLVGHELPEHPEYEANANVAAVYLSPVTVYKDGYPRSEVADIFSDYIDQDATQANYRRAANLVMIRGGKYRLSLQTHLFIGIE